MSDSKKVIFLDIDGVLNNDQFRIDKWMKEHPGKTWDPYYCFNKENVEQFNRVIRETNASVVASTTWRLGPTLREPMTPKFLQNLIKENGGAECEIVGFTPHLMPKKLSQWIAPRYKEIQAYIDEAKWHDVRFVVVDDRDDAWSGWNFVRTDPRVGLTREDADRMIGILNGTIEPEP